MTHRSIRSLLLALLAWALAAPVALALDEDAAQALAKQNKCTKCHSVDKKKDGPSFKETAAKYKGKADAADSLFKHLTSSPMVKVDGQEEEHTADKGNPADVRNLVDYILSR